MEIKNNEKEQIKILSTITTTPGSDWRNKIKEINELKIDEIALFPTAIDKKDRHELYKLLKESIVTKIPFVHLRSDMDISEIDYFVKNYETKVFNTHTVTEYPINREWLKYREIIFIENVHYPLNEEEIQTFKGMCLDFSHLENDRIMNKNKFEHNIKMFEKYRIGCGHISAIKKETWFSISDKYDENKNRHDFHKLDNLSELDYLKNYPRRYFAPYIAIELENSTKEQLEVRDYIENIIKTLK